MSVNEILLRLRSNWATKLAITFGLMVAFAVFYVLPQQYPVFAVTYLQPTRLDRMISFMPASAYLYDSLYLFMPIAPWLLRTKCELTQYTKGFLFMTAVASCFFFLWPTAVLRPPEVRGANFLYERLSRLDNDLNAVPSLHAAYALFHGECCHSVFHNGKWHNLLRGFFWIWASAIAASTLVAKQHVAIDVVAGVALGLGSFAFCCRHIESHEVGPVT